jgi:hypothetical protein
MAEQNANNVNITGGSITGVSGLGTVTSVAATAGTGISVTGSPITTSGTLNITNTAPDQIVAIASGTGISVTGTYPNFSVANTAPSSGGTVTSVALSGGTTGLTVTGSPITTSGTITLAGTLAIANGGTGETTRQNAMDALAGAVTSGSYLRGNGTDVVMATIQAGDVPTLNQNTTGSAATLTTGRTIAITGDLAYTSPSFNGSTNVTAAGTLATVNANVGSFTNASVTVNGKGLVTAVSSGTAPVTSVTGTSPVVSSGGATPAISMAAANGTTNGYLTSTDWTTFNNKGSGTVTSVTATSPVTSTGGATPVIAMPAATTSVNGYLTSTDWNTFNSKGSGTVTAVSVASANGFTGTSSGGATPALTLTTSITGVLKGNGTAISAATAGTDYSAGTSALGTGILKSTTTTGALTIAVAADFPTLNQNTTGTAANVTGTVAIANGGTGQTTANTAINALLPSQTGNNGKVLSTNGTDTSWIASGGSGTVTSVAQTFTGGIVSVAGSPITTAGTLALTVAGTSGGIPYFSSATGWASSAALASNALVVGGGAGVSPSTITTGTGVTTALGVNTGTAGAFVVNGGALGTPSSGTLTNCTFPTLNQNTTGTAANVTGTVAIANGGTGQTTATAAFNALSPITTTGDLIIGNGSNSATRLAIGTNAQVLTSNGTTATWATPSGGGSAATPTALGTVFGDTDSASPFTTALGNSALASATGTNNTAAGWFAANGVTTGASNSVFGANAMRANTDGGFNSAFGAESLRLLTTTGGGNTALGAEALYSNTASFNTGVGRGAGYAISTGANNLCVGYNAGKSGTNNLTTGSNNIIIGVNAAASSATVSNETTIGNSSTTMTRIFGKLELQNGAYAGISATVASASTITPTSDTTNQYTVTALAAAATIAIPTGTPDDGQRLTIRIKDNGTARALTWTTSAGGYRIVGTTLPTTTVVSKVLYVGCIYNSQDSFWDVIAVAQQA